MKNKFWHLSFLLCLLISSAYSQSKDTLLLEIKGLTSLKVVLKKFGKDTITFTPAEERLNTSSDPWFFKISTKQNVFIVITNSEGDGRLSDTLKIFNKAYTINNDIIIDDSFLLKANFKIEIFNKANNGKIKSFQISYNQGKKKTEGNSSEYKFGSTIYDAMYIANGTNEIIKSKILSHYGNNLTGQKLVDEYSKNKFLDSLSKRIINKTGQEGAINLGSIVSSIGGLDVTSLADGLAKFLVKRTKQELNIAFFDKFKKFISKYPDLRTVFPQTYKALNIIGDEIYNYEAYIQTLRESFENDLSTLDKNLPSIIENHPDFFTAHPELAATLNSGCYIAGALSDKVHPGDILKDYPVSYLDSLNKNWKGAIQTLQLFSASLRDSATNTDSVYWVSAKQVKTLIKDSTAFKIYLGLIYQEAKNNYDSIHYSFKNIDTTLIDLLNALGKGFDKDYSSYKDFISQFSEKTTKLNTMIKNYKKPANDSLAFEQYYNYFNSSIDMLQHCTNISKLKYIDSIVPNLANDFKDYFDVAHSTADLVLDIKRRNYALAVVNAVHIYDLVKVKHSAANNADVGDRRKLHKAMLEYIENPTSGKPVIHTEAAVNYSNREIKKVNKEIADELVDKALTDTEFSIDSTYINNLRQEKLKALKKENNYEGNMQMKDDTLRKMYKYGAFMATMVQAKSPDDVEKAIEAFALPTGSARIKRESPFNVSLNAYTGLFAGYEKINGVDNNWKLNSYGVTAPIGISISRGHSIFFLGTGKDGWISGKKGWSTSLFISMIDIGALAAFRFKNDTTIIKPNITQDTLTISQAPAIQLKNIISPGVFLSIGIPKCPLSVNFGVQMGANLRKVTSTDNMSKLNFSDNVYWRYSISLCVDIPIFNFYTKSN